MSARGYHPFREADPAPGVLIPHAIKGVLNINLLYYGGDSNPPEYGPWWKFPARKGEGQGQIGTDPWLVEGAKLTVPV